MEDHTVSTLYQSGSQQPQGTNGLSNNSDNTEMYEMLTMATHERSSEYQQLQICTGNQGLTKLTIEEYCKKNKKYEEDTVYFHSHKYSNACNNHCYSDHTISIQSQSANVQ